MTYPPSAMIRAILMRATFWEIRGSRRFHARLRLGSHRSQEAHHERNVTHADVGGPSPSSGCSEAARRSGGSDAERASRLRALDDVQVRGHVDVGGALDDGLALAILLDPAQIGRASCRERV